MQLGKLDHVNIRTANLDAMIEWYGSVLGLESGARPPFAVPGAWLYCGADAAVHLVATDATSATSSLQIEHFAFSATGLESFLARLKQQGVSYRARRVPVVGIVQVNICDPDGNHIHVDFTADETEGLEV